MINYKQELNDEQYKVTTEGDGACLVLAGAGSGKTRAITYRVAYLLEQGVNPEEILLMTFTNKAAREMTERVSELTGGEVKLPWAGTFHHVCYKVLRRYAPLMGYNHNFTILDSADSVDLMKLCTKAIGVDRKSRRFPSPKVLANIISYTRNAETTIEDTLDLKHPQWLDITDTITGIAEEYRKRKVEANAMDFDDLLVNTYLLFLKHTRVREQYANQFRYVLVDEYQDTNRVQASIVKQFASVHGNILVVGDDAQSIYSFRAADVQNILDFERDYPTARTFRLETNYRSTPQILDVANRVIEHNTNQYQKSLKAVRDTFIRPEVHAFADQVEEAEFIAKRILELREEGVELDHIAVLFRAAAHSQSLEVELTKRDIPYEFRGGVRFFERAHIKDVLAFVKVFANPNDEIAWSRVLTMQVGIGPAAVQKVLGEVRRLFNTSSRAEQSVVERSRDFSTASSANVSESSRNDVQVLSAEQVRHFGSMLTARAQVGFNDFLQVYEDMWSAVSQHVILSGAIEESRDFIGIKRIDDYGQDLSMHSATTAFGRDDVVITPSILLRAVINSKYKDYLETEYVDYRERLSDLEQLANYAEKRDDVALFLADITMQETFTAAQARRNDSGYDDEENVVLSTVHQAKGLEWEAVFVLGVSAGQFPSERSAREHKGLEEERRLFYVAVTRARKHLTVSYPLVGGYNHSLQGPSMFIEEVGDDLFDHNRGFSGSTFFSAPATFPEDDGDIRYVSEDEPIGRTTSFFSSVDDL